MGGSGSGGTTTTSTKQGLPTWEIPYAKSLTGQAQNLFSGGTYPQQQTAPLQPNQLQAIQNVQNLTPQQQAYSNVAQQANAALAAGQNPAVQTGTDVLTGLAQGTPALQAGTNALANIAAGGNAALNYGTDVLANIAGGGSAALNQAQGTLGSIASGADPLMQQAAAANYGLLNNPYINQAQAANAAIVGGQNLYASSNPYLQSYLQAGMLPMIQNYEQAVAPNIVANAVGGGGLGGSGESQAFQNAQSALAQGLGTYAAGVVEPAYQAALGQQAAAIQAAPGLLSPYETGISNLGNLVGQQTAAAGALPGTVTPQISAAGQIPGMIQPQISAAGALPGMYQPQLSAATAIPGMLAPQQTAIAQTPSLVSGAYTPSQELMAAGTTQQQQAQNVLNTLFQNQMMPYNMLQMGAGLVSPISGGSGQSFQVSTAPGGTMK